MARAKKTAPVAEVAVVEPPAPVADANDPVFATENHKVVQAALEAKFIEALKKSGDGVKIGVLRAIWKMEYPTFAAYKDKQQKAVMRRTINRLLEKKLVIKDGMLISLAK
jgi:hypothetical protein